LIKSKSRACCAAAMEAKMVLVRTKRAGELAVHNIRIS
jgi:hypothetical protein